jgi:hypothetical protein
MMVLVATLAVAVACTKSNSAGPSPSIGAPRPLAPANGASIRNADQPVTLVVQNGAVTAAAGTVYTFEVATDAAFTAKMQSKTGVAEGAGGQTVGQTAVKLDTLPAAKDYYWHVLASNGSTTGIFGAVYKFTIGPAIIINAPAPIGPLTGQTTDQRPVLRVTNATRTGPAGAITYRFEIATSADFTSIVMTGTNTEGVNETGFIPPTDLLVNTTFFWRATAIDAANGITSPPSAAQSFTTSKPSQAQLVAAQLGVPLWPGEQPPGSVGHATMGSFWNVEFVVSFNGVRFLNPPIDEVRIFDLLDRGMDPQSAIDWMNGHGYPTSAAYYPAVNVIGFQFEYLAFINGQWDIVLKVGA